MNYSKMNKGQLIALLREADRINEEKPAIGASYEVAQICREMITRWKQEHFIVLFMDGAGIVTHSEMIFKGTLNSSLVHPREIFSVALEQRSANIIIAHNHPSGKLVPSSEDVALTRRIVSAGDLMGIPVLDHVIFSPMDYFSFKAEGLLTGEQTA